MSLSDPMLPSNLQSQFPLHWNVWGNDYSAVDELLKAKDSSGNSKVCQLLIKKLESVKTLRFSR